MQQKNRIQTHKEVQYIKVHRNVSKALDLEDEEEILDLISEREDETEKESLHSFMAFQHRKKMDSFDGTAYLSALIGYICLGIVFILIKFQSTEGSTTFSVSACFRGLFIAVIGMVVQRI